MTIDYTTLITSEHRAQPNFNALVNLLANGAGAVSTFLDSLAGSTGTPVAGPVPPKGLINTAAWQIGSADTQANFTTLVAGTSKIVQAGTAAWPLDPYGGGTAPLWYGTARGITNADAGWIDNGDLTGLDPTQSYRSAVWFYIGDGSSGSWYHGCGTAGNTVDLNGAADPNPYFTSAVSSRYIPGKWYLSIGLIHGSGYTGGDTGMSGIYDPVTGRQVFAGTEFQMAPGATTQTHRTFIYYSTTTAPWALWARPRFEVVNSSMPSIATLLSAAGLLSYYYDSPRPAVNVLVPGAFDLDVAAAPQLDIDGQWVGQPRAVSGVLAVGFFGFSDDVSALGFTEIGQPSVGGRFFELKDSSTATALLSDPEYRSLIRAKILQNNWNADPASFETALSDIVNINNTGATIPTQVLDPGSKVVSILTPTAIDPVAYALLTKYDILPRAAGVRYQYLQPLPAPYNWTAVGTATASGTTVSKPTGVSAWDSSAYVAAPASAVYVAWMMPSNAEQIMGGVAANPGGSPNYPTLNLAIYCANNLIQIYEAGVNRGSFGPYSAGDTFAVLYDNYEGVYFHNGQVIRTVVVTLGAISPMFVLDNVGAQITNIFLATGN